MQCDEFKPSCQKCVSYFIRCDYDDGVRSELQSSVRGAMDSEQLQYYPRIPHISQAEAILSVLNSDTSLGDSGSHPSFSSPTNYHFSMQDLRILHRFQQRTLWTMGAGAAIGKERQVYKVAYEKLTMSVRLPSRNHSTLTK